MIKIIIGPVASGKTTRLIEFAHESHSFGRAIFHNIDQLDIGSGIYKDEPGRPVSSPPVNRYTANPKPSGGVRRKK